MIPSLGTPYAAGVALKRQKDEKKKKEICHRSRRWELASGLGDLQISRYTVRAREDQPRRALRYAEGV